MHAAPDQQPTHRVFTAPGAAGNRARVVVLDSEPGPAELSALAPATTAAAVCFVWPRTALQAAADTTYQVACYQGGRAVRCCGHGILASAHQLWRSTGRAPQQLQACAGEAIRCEQRDEHLWLYFRRLRCHPVDVMPRLAAAFAQPPLTAALCGDGAGYCVLEWPAATELRTLDPDIPRIAAATSRAVIATSRHGTDRVQLRYFAPRYGMPEDAVTGSACRVLGDYWQRRGLDRFEARQRSVAGGVVQVETSSREVAISGRVTVIPGETIATENCS